MDQASGISRRRAAAKDEANPAYLQKRAELVQAAARVFKAKGLQRSNLGDIATEAGSDRASLYYYVASKEELFHEVVRGTVEANLTAARELRDSEGSPADKLRALIEQLMVSYAENYPILYVFIQENLSHVPDKDGAWAAHMRRTNKDYEQIVIDLITEGMRDGSMRDVGPPWIVAYGLMGMVGWTNRWFNPDTSPATAVQIARTFADTLLGGLVTTRPRRRT